VAEGAQLAGQLSHGRLVAHTLQAGLQPGRRLVGVAAQQRVHIGASPNERGRRAADAAAIVLVAIGRGTVRREWSGMRALACLQRSAARTHPSLPWTTAKSSSMQAPHTVALSFAAQLAGTSEALSDGHAAWAPLQVAKAAAMASSMLRMAMGVLAEGRWNGWALHHPTFFVRSFSHAWHCFHTLGMGP
jgi:hypothetical protein